MSKRLEGFGEVVIGDEKNGFALDFVTKTEREFWGISTEMGAIL